MISGPVWLVMLYCIAGAGGDVCSERYYPYAFPDMRSCMLNAGAMMKVDPVHFKRVVGCLSDVDGIESIPGTIPYNRFT